MESKQYRQNNWKNLYRAGGAAAYAAVAVGLLEIVITFLPGGNTVQETVIDWFTLFQQNSFMGLRDLGLLNIVLDTLAILIFLGLYAAHDQSPRQPEALLAMLVAFLGIGVFLATNRAFPMLALSKSYAAAVTGQQRLALEAAGQALLSVGQSHTAGTFLGFFLTEAAGIMISITMRRSKMFSHFTASVGVLGFGLLLIFEFITSFFSGLTSAAMLLAMVGGLASMAWYILTGMRLFRLSRINDGH